jgi:hypothetical protein
MSVAMEIPLGTVFSVRVSPTVTSPNCRVTAGRSVFRAFRPKAIYEEPVVGFAAAQPLPKTFIYLSSPPFDSGIKKKT